MNWCRWDLNQGFHDQESRTLASSKTPSQKCESIIVYQSKNYLSVYQGTAGYPESHAQALSSKTVGVVGEHEHAWNKTYSSGARYEKIRGKRLHPREMLD